jgi:nucleotide-binding universal stress UspA family protein
MFRDLLVHVDGTKAARGRVQLAASLAGRMGAKLAGLHVTPQTDIPYRYKPSRVAEALERRSIELAANSEMATRVFAEETKGASAWLYANGDVVRRICEHARYADLVILGSYERQLPIEAHPLPVAHSVALQCGRPVLVVPGNCHHATFDRAVIAWDGSREAVRAVHDALPLLSQARSAHVVRVVRASTEVVAATGEAANLVAHLKSHGISANHDVMGVVAMSEHQHLRNVVVDGQFDLVVMGAYSRSQWLEFVFGGATDTILPASTTPVLVSH